MAIVNDERKYEDAAEVTTVTGWACKKCRRYWGSNEHMARYCCSTTFPCDCGGRFDKHESRCKNCQATRDTKTWFAKTKVEWNGEFPIVIDYDFFFFKDDLPEHLYENSLWDGQQETLKEALEGLRIEPCRPTRPGYFDMNEYLCDSLPEDGEIACDDINKTVNDWIAEQGPLSYEVTGKRLCNESVWKGIRSTDG